MNRISVKVTTLFFVLLLLAFVGGLSNTVQAQVDTGSISGSVHDTSGGLVPGATVTATNTTTAAERTTKTGSVGQYTLQGLPPANYKVRIASPNFTTFETVVEVTVGGALTVNAELQIGTSSTVVEVTAGAGTEVNTQTQELSQLVDTTQLSSLPSLDRNPYDFVVLSGNVSNGDNTTASMSSSQTAVEPRSWLLD